LVLAVAHGSAGGWEKFPPLPERNKAGLYCGKRRFFRDVVSDANRGKDADFTPAQASCAENRL
jgi:hypothetical protein